MFQDILVAALSLLDVVSGAILAMAFGFLLLPSAAGFLVGAIGSLLSGSMTPVSFQQEGLVLARDMGKKMPERVNMILLAGFITGLTGILGLPQLIIDSLGKEIFFGMMAGVGLYLARVGLDLSREDWVIGLPAVVVALAVQLWTNNLVWAIAASVPLGMLIKAVKERATNQKVEVVVPQYSSFMEGIRAEFKPYRLMLNGRILVGGLALSFLTWGSLAYAAVNSDISGLPAKYNAVSVVSGLADFVSSLFGGASMEVIVSATAAAPHPIFSGVLLMIGAAIVIVTGLVFKVAKYVPISAMGGYLVAIGAVLVLPYNAMDAFAAGNPLVVAITMGVTAGTNPFFGVIAGLLAKALLWSLGAL